MNLSCSEMNAFSKTGFFLFGQKLLEMERSASPKTIHRAFAEMPSTSVGSELASPTEHCIIQAIAAIAAKRAPPVRTKRYALFLLNSISHGIVMATTKSCMTSMPRLNPRMLSASLPALKSRLERTVANASLCIKPKRGNTKKATYAC